MANVLQFTCPRCGSHSITEVMVEMVVDSKVDAIIEIDGAVELQYGEQTNEGGHVDHYCCGGCGLWIVDDHSEHADDGLDAHALAKAIRALNAEHLVTGLVAPAEAEKSEKGDPVSFGDLIQRVTDNFVLMSEEELADEWNKLCPDNPVVYEGDSLFWVKK